MQHGFIVRRVRAIVSWMTSRITIGRMTHEVLGFVCDTTVPIALQKTSTAIQVVRKKKTDKQIIMINYDDKINNTVRRTRESVASVFVLVRPATFPLVASARPTVAPINALRSRSRCTGEEGFPGRRRHLRPSQ